MTDTDLIAQADAVMDGVKNRDESLLGPAFSAMALASLVPALRDALAAALTRAEAMEAERDRLRKATLDVRLFLDTGFTEMGDGRMTYSNVDILSMLDLLDRAALYGEPQP